MKKYRLLLLFFLIVMINPVMAQNDFDIDDNHVLKKYNGSAVNVEIPSGVTAIGYEAFNCNESIETVTIPSGVKSIGGSAFGYCHQLKRVIIPDTVESIGSYAFSDCSHLTSIELPNSVKSIGNSAFLNCTNLTDVTLPDGLSTIGSELFKNCSSLEHITIPFYVTAINSEAFYGCSSLTEITIPSNVWMFPIDGFAGCTNLTRITLPASLQNVFTNDNFPSSNGDHSPNWYSITDHTWYSPEEIVSGRFGIPDSYYSYVPSADTTAIVIKNPEGTVVGDSYSGNHYSFQFSAYPEPSSASNIMTWTSSDPDIAMVDYEGNVNFIEAGSVVITVNSNDGSGVSASFNLTYEPPEGEPSWSFVRNKYNGNYINILTISGSGVFTAPNAESVPWYEFRHSIQRVVIKSGITEIGENYFAFHDNLSSVTIPDSVTAVGASAFQGCEKLESVSLPTNLQSIGDRAFWGTGLKKLTIPKFCKNMGDYAFSNSAALKTVTIPSNGNIRIGNHAFENCTSLESLTNQGTRLTSIGEYAFAYCTNLSSIIFNYGSSAVNSGIGDYAFLHCTNLTDLSFLSRLSAIGNAMFADCTGLTDITIPDSISTIGDNAFANCTNLHSIAIPSGVRSIGNSAIPNANGAQAPDWFSLRERVWYAPAEITERTRIEDVYYASIPDPLPVSTSIDIFDAENNSIKGSTINLSHTTYQFSVWASPLGALQEFEVSSSDPEIAVVEITGTSGTISFNKGGTVTFTVRAKDNENVSADFVIKIVPVWSIKNHVLTISGLGVFDIDKAANVPWYNSRSGITKVVIEDGITEIGDYYFYEFSKLSEIEIPAGLTAIGKYAFEKCSSLPHIDIPSGVTSIGMEAFAYCTGFDEITIPSGVERIENFTFSNCTNLINAELPDGLTFIGQSAFIGCSSLSEITIPPNVTYIGETAFERCSALSKISIPASVTTIGTRAIPRKYGDHGAKWYSLRDQAWYSIDEIRGRTGIADTYFPSNPFPDTIAIHIKNHEGLDVTAGDIFWNQFTYQLSASQEPERASDVLIWTISDQNIATVDSTGNVTFRIVGTVTITVSATDGSDVSSSINLTYEPNEGEPGWSVIYDSPYHLESTLTLSGTGVYNVEAPEDLPWMSSEYCSGIHKVVIEDGISKIGDYYFSFYGPGLYNTALREVEIPESVTTIGSHAFDHAYMTSIKIPSGVTSIGSYAFSHSNLNSIEIPSSVIAIGEYAFESCNSLSSVKIQNGVTSVGNNAFQDCNGLNYIEIPESVIQIGEAVFPDAGSGDHSPNWYSVRDHAWYSPEFIGTRTGIADIYTLEIPASSVSIAIKDEEGNIVTGSVISTLHDIIRFSASAEPEDVPQIFNWSSSDPEIASVDNTGKVTFINVGTVSITVTAIDNSEVSASLTLTYAPEPDWSISGDTLTISGKGVYDVESETELPWYPRRSEVKKIVISDGITAIGNHYFAYFYRLKSIEISGSVKSIGASAFYRSTIESVEITSSVRFIGADAFSGCRYLTEIEIPNGVTSIEDGVFENCDSLGHVVIPETVTSIGARAFAWCEQLPEIIIPSAVTAIGDYAFARCMNLSEITLPNRAVTLGKGLFSYCTNLENIGFPSGLTSIGEEWFKNCTGLEHIEIPNSVTTIGNNAFYGCSNLGEIEWPTGLRSIGRYAFALCQGFTSLDIPASVESIGECAFYSCAMQNVTIPANVTVFGKYIFQNCESLENVTFQNGVTTIAEYMFDHCSNLKHVEIPGTVTSIGTAAFRDCVSLSEIEIPVGVESIGADAFLRCYDLQKIVIPTGVTSIGRWAFVGCSKVESISLPASLTSIDPYAFQGSNNENFRDSWFSFRDRRLFTYSELSSRTGIEDFYYCEAIPSSVNILNPNGTHNHSFEMTEHEAQFSASGDPRYSMQTFIWSSSDTSIAEVDETGKISFKKPGTVILKAETFFDSSIYRAILVTYSLGDLKIVLPAGLNSIQSGAFAGVENVVIQIPGGVEFIAEDAFEPNVTVICESGSASCQRCRDLGLFVIEE